MRLSSEAPPPTSTLLGGVAWKPHALSRHRLVGRLNGEALHATMRHRSDWPSCPFVTTYEPGRNAAACQIPYQAPEAQLGESSWPSVRSLEGSVPVRLRRLPAVSGR